MGPLIARRRRSSALVLVIVASLCAVLPSSGLSADASPTPSAAAALEPSLLPAQAACDVADDLRLVIEFLRETDGSEDGWASVIVGAIAGLSLARDLLGLVGETYRPLVDDLVASFEGLRATAEGLRDQATLGAGLAAIGEAITAIGTTMDAISAELRTPCPTPA
jgi:hypothetical protein